LGFARCWRETVSGLENRRPAEHIRAMAPLVPKIAGWFVVLGVAVVAAFALAHIAHDDLGVSRHEIRTQALIGAAVLAMLMAVEYFGKKFRKPK
jgi:hypothetical protein